MKMNPETLAFTVALLVLVAGATGFYFGVKIDMGVVQKAERLGIPYVVGDSVYRVIRGDEWDAAVKAANQGISETHKREAGK